jgi:hypothetical protein
MKITSTLVLGMNGVFNPIMNKPHFYQPNHKLVLLPTMSSNVIKLLDFLCSMFNTGESNLDIFK